MLKLALGILLMILGVAVFSRPWIVSRGRKVSDAEFERARLQFLVGVLLTGVGVVLVAL